MLEFRKVSKSFSEVKVLRDVSFSITEGKVTALMGENGAGKSTLMKILAGAIQDYEGRIFFQNKELISANTKEAEQAGISMIYQELNLVPDLSIGENIFLGKEPERLGFVDFKEIHEQSNKLLQEFDFPYSSDQSVKNISLGWQQLVEIVKALHLNSQLIIMDEPTSSLTESEKENLFKKIKYLRGIGKTIVYISHRMSEIFEIADEVVIMRDGMSVGQFPVAEITREQIVELMIGKSLSANPASSKNISSEEILRFEDVSVATSKHTKLKNISFNLNKGEVLGVSGLLGSGRSSLLRFIYGALNQASFSGTINLDGKEYHPKTIGKAQLNKIIYLTEDRKGEGIFPLLGIGDNTSAAVLKRISRAGFVNRQKEISYATDTLEKVNAKYHSLHQAITRLSGGNQQKVLLSRILLTEPKLILLDEPTRGIDVGAKEEIYELIRKLTAEGMSFMISSSEIPELEQICNKILVLSSGHQTALLQIEKTNAQEVLKYAFEKV